VSLQLQQLADEVIEQSRCSLRYISPLLIPRGRASVTMPLRSHLQAHTFVRAGIKAEHTMFTNLKIGSVLVALVCIAVGCMTGSASVVTAQLAKKCQALTAKAFPPLVPGNPAAGSAKGTGQSQRDYFNKCVANGGNMDDDASKRTK